MKRPSFQFYPGDWQRDTALRLCSIGARGCWMEMLCIMHQAQPYGYLMHEGKALQAKHVASLVGGGATTKQVQEWLDELEAEGVFTRDADGCIFSRRMIRDEAVRQARANGGKAGAEHGFKGAEHGKKGGRPRKDTGDKKPPLPPPTEPPPSSSSSSSIKDLAAAALHPRARDPVDNSPPPPAASGQAPPGSFAQLLGTWERERGKAAAFRADDPLLAAWADAGVNEAELRAAYDRAVKRRAKTHDDAPVNAGLIDVMLPEVRHAGGATSALSRARAMCDPLAWAASASGLTAKGAELGIVQQDGEIFPNFKARVMAAAGLTENDRDRLRADYGVHA